MFFWLLTREVARDCWLLTGWRGETPQSREVLVTPYIEFEDGAQLKEFLRLNNHIIYTSQVSTHNWLIANQLYNIGRINEDVYLPTS